MSFTITVNKKSQKDKLYEEIVPQLEHLISADEPILSNLANFSAALFNAFEDFSWTGFYIAEGDSLYLGPFQGNTACTVIKIGEGVCGQAALQSKTIIVPDVNLFPGHIFCDAKTKSEIVVPINYKGKIFGVLDIDSYQLAEFDETDKFFLEKATAILTSKLNLSNFKLQ